MKRKPEKDISSSSEEDLDEEEEQEEPLKVYFSSRTHSQLAQFVGELKRTKFATSLQSVSLGSRKTLCINPGKRILFQNSRYYGSLLSKLSTSSVITLDDIPVSVNIDNIISVEF